MARKGNMKQIDLGVGEEEGREVRGWGEEKGIQGKPGMGKVRKGKKER